MENQIEIYGIRSIIEAIEASKEISKVYLLKTNSSQSSLLRSLIILLERKNIKSSFVPKEKFRKYSDKNHQGAVAILSPVSLLSIEDLISSTFDEKLAKTPTYGTEKIEGIAPEKNDTSKK